MWWSWITGWGSVRPTWGRARQMGLADAPAVSDEFTGRVRIRVRGFRVEVRRMSIIPSIGGEVLT